jgi:hypothetical protein
MRAAIAAAALLLIGCGGGYRALQPGTVYERFQTDDKAWMIWDRAAESRLVISPTPGTAARFAPNLPKPDYQRATESWLVSAGRLCTIMDGYPLQVPQWEFLYRCAPASAP